MPRIWGIRVWGKGDAGKHPSGMMCGFFSEQPINSLVLYYAPLFIYRIDAMTIVNRCFLGCYICADC